MKKSKRTWAETKRLLELRNKLEQRYWKEVKPNTSLHVRIIRGGYLIAEPIA